jgi:hypothetical protein
MTEVNVTAGAADGSLLSDFEAKVSKLYKELEGKTEAELRALYADALVAESDAKKEVTILRQRAANLAADTDVTAEKAVIEAKKELAMAAAWLKALEGRLSGSLKDHNTAQSFE